MAKPNPFICHIKKRRCQDEHKIQFLAATQINIEERNNKKYSIIMTDLIRRPMNRNFPQSLRGIYANNKM